MIICQFCKDRGDKTSLDGGRYRCESCKSTFPGKLKEAFRKYIDSVPPEFVLFEDPIWFNRHSAEQEDYQEAKRIFRELQMFGKVLHVGCGYGWHAVEWKRLGLHVNGIEWNNNAVVNCVKFGVDVYGIGEEQEIVGVPKSAYDLVLVSPRIASFWSPQRLVELSKSSCKPTGRVRVAGKVPTSSPVFEFSPEAMQKLYGLDEWNGQRGLEIKTVEIKIGGQ